jgi:hypothetical protein
MSLGDSPCISPACPAAPDALPLLDRRFVEKMRPARVDRSGLRISFAAGFGERRFFAVACTFLPEVFLRFGALAGAVAFVLCTAFFLFGFFLFRDLIAPPDFFFAMEKSLSRI